MSAVIGIVAGVVSMMLLVSLLASAVVEGISGIFRLRASMLERALFATLTGAWNWRAHKAAVTTMPAAASNLLGDPTIATGSPRWLRKDFRVSYLPTEQFVDLVFTHYLGGVRTHAATVHGQIGAMQPLKTGTNDKASIETVLERLWEDAGHDVGVLRTRLGRHYDDTMNRVSGWYRRRTRWMLFATGIVVAVGLNIGLLSMVRTLWSDSTVRVGLESVARQSQPPGDLTTNLANAGTALRHASGEGLPIGWGNHSAPSTAGGWIAAIVGWLAVGAGVSFGAPFWFDVLGRFVNLRLAGPHSGGAPGSRAGQNQGPAPGPAPNPLPPLILPPSDDEASGRTTATPGPTTPSLVMTAFEPNVHGFHFDNDFDNQFPQPFGSTTITTFGRCGGMVYAGLDLYKAARPVPEVSDVPVDTSPLARYLLARLFDSWANPSAVRFLTWTLEDDATVTKRTAREIRLLCARLDQGEPTPLGLVAARTLEDVGHGHQVLAIGYERTAEGTVVVHTWDNNHAGVVTTLTVTPGEYGIVSNRRSNPYRGFFMHTYTPQSPPENLAAI